ncbi:MAG: DUF503 domain-containing protein [Thermomicrobiaceae bacterium]|nr:DUF503 domain-containing protein [Thermomicrobiaceae bacterium]
MVVGVCHLTLRIPDAHSLKEKRRTVKSLTQRVQSRFNVSIAEVDDLDVWQVATIGLACVSNSSRHVDETLSSVIRFVEENLQSGFLADVRTEILHVA